MKKRNWLKAVLLTGVLAGCFVLSAGATHLAMGTVQGEGLRLRAAPSDQGAVITSAHRGDIVVVLEQVGEWYKVDYGTQVGYMATDYVYLSKSVENDLGYAKVTTSSGSLNLRAAPGTDSAKVSSLPNGSVVNLIGFQNGWYHVTYDGQTGYASSDYLTIVKDAQGTRVDNAAVVGSDLGQRIVAEAKKHLGQAYVYGTHGPDTFDCSGFVHYCVKQASGGSIILPTSSSPQWTSAPGQRIYSIDQMQPGDIFFIDDPAYGGNYKLVTHAAIYMGDGQMIHASTSKTGVISNPVRAKDYRYFVGAIRLG